MGAAETETERRTSNLELFFDLVFVFAVTQTTSLVAHRPGAATLGEAALVFGLVWWAWGGYAWLTNAIDLGSGVVRVLLLAAAAGSVFVAISLPRAFGSDGLRFVAAYLFVRVLHICLYFWGLRGDRDHLRAFLQLAPWFLLAPLVAFAGGLVHGDARVALWAASLAIDVGGALSLPSENGFRVSPAHFAERYSLFVIIALGESVVAIGASVESLPRNALFFESVLAAFALACLLWWSYFDFTAQAAERALRFVAPNRRGPVARDVFSLFHFPTVLGIVYVAVGVKLALHDPAAPLGGGGRAALGLGVALYLSGFALARYRVVRRVAWERLAGIAAVAALAAAATGVEAVWLIVGAVAIVGLVTVAESLRLREVRARVRADVPPVDTPNAEA
jgi:low temperature requirement protein LtrA